MRYPARTDVYVFSRGGKTLVFDTASSGFVCVPEPVGTAVRLCGTHSRSEILRASESVTSRAEARAALRSLDGLFRLGILKPEKAAPPEPSTDPSHRTLSLALSHGCNLRCDYCFAGGHSPAERDGPLEMPMQVVDQAISFLLNDFGKDAEHCHVGFGVTGEPLVCARLHDQVAARLEAAAARSGKVITFGIGNTNLTLACDPETLERIRPKPNQRPVSVTLDGPKHVHDAMRKFQDGRGTYDEVVDKARALLEGPIKPRVTATLTGLHPNVTEVFLHLYELGFRTIEIRAVKASHDKPYSLNPQTLQAFKEGYEEFAAFLLEQDDATLLDYLLALWGGKDHLGIILRYVYGHRRHPYKCGAGRHYLYCDTSGDLYACAQMCGMKEHRVGSVFERMSESAERLYHEDLAVDNRETCRACWARYVCGGGCYLTAVLNASSIERCDPCACELNRLVIELAIYLLATLLETRPNVFAALPDPARKPPLELQGNYCPRYTAPPSNRAPFAQVTSSRSSGIRAPTLSGDGLGPPIMVAQPNQMKGRLWGGPLDTSGAVRLGWDEENLYVVAEVRDELVSPGTGDLIHSGDGIRLVIAPQPTDEDQHWWEDEFRIPGQSYELLIGLSPIRIVLVHNPREGRGDALDLPLQVDRHGSVIHYRLALPWSLLGIGRPALGTALGLNFAILDEDGHGGRRGEMEWLPDRPYGTIRLGPALVRRRGWQRHRALSWLRVRKRA